MSEEIRFALLGPMRAWRGSTEVVLGPPKQRAVLATLLVREGSPVSAEQLTAAVWGEQQPASAVGMLRIYVHRLRRALDGEQRDPVPVIRSVGDGYLVHPASGTLDFTVFHEHLARADRARREGDLQLVAASLGNGLAVWEGSTAMDGVPGPFAQAQRDRLAQLRLTALEDWLSAEVETGRHTEAAARLSDLVQQYPLAERLRELLMLALYRSGHQAAALTAYREAQVLLRDELSAPPGPALQELHQRILGADPALLVTASIADRAGTALIPIPSESSGPLAADHPAPAQLPADNAVFTGRHTELAKAQSLLSKAGDRPAATTITAVTGMGGIGKTAFAIHLAHRITDLFPDGQIFVDLRGFDPVGSPVTTEGALRSLLEALGVPTIDQPQDAGAQAALLRTLLRDRRVLLVLDNARDAEQVRPLLQGGRHCLTLITSRDQLGGLSATNGAHRIELDVLLEPEAHDFLARRLGRRRTAAEPAAVREIIERCAHFPLALALVAARALVRQAFPLASIASELHASQSLDAFDDPDRTLDVRSVFSWSYQALSPDSRRLFRLLALHPGPDFSLPVVADLAGLPMPRTRELLGELIQAHLVSESRHGRHRSHDLLTAYARELIEATEAPELREAARRRVMDHLLYTAYAASGATATSRVPITLPPAADGVRPETFPHAEQASAWFSAERAVLIASVAQASQVGCDDHAWRLAWAMDNNLYRQGLWLDLAATQQLALESACRLGDPAAQAHAHRGLARAAGGLLKVDDAIDHVERAIELFSRSGDMTACAETHRQMSWVLERQGSVRHALSHALRALELHRAAGNDALLGPALNAVGWYHAQLGQYDDALEYCQKALVICEQHDDLNPKTDTWDSLGYIHHQLGRHQEAVRCYRNALDLYPRGDMVYAAAETLDRLGDTHVCVEEFEEASAVWEQSHSLLEQLQHPHAENVSAKLAGLPAPAAR